MDGIEVLVVPVTDFDPYYLKHGEERRKLLKLATLEDAGLKRSALLKYFKFSGVCGWWLVSKKRLSQ
jgi:hypothetical protein